MSSFGSLRVPADVYVMASARPRFDLFTGIAGDKPVLVRDFVHSALYHPKHGYFSQRAPSVGVLERSIKFNQLEGRKAYMNYLDKVYKGSGIS